ncbi:MAG: type II toxin-antitoxin system PrlF family antitoxin [Lautropia sp.]|nr:type II toxin-antitoxin system PrlF family antitoxin [Lautropia sp.]
MQTTLTRKGQVTIPQHIRLALGLLPGAKVEFSVREDGDVVLRKVAAEENSDTPLASDRFEAVRGKADIKWRTDALMALLRGEADAG